MSDAPTGPDPNRWIDLARESSFELGRAIVRPPSCEVLADGATVRLQPRVMQVLVALFRANGELVSRDSLIDRCWGGVAVGEDAINRCVQRLRRLAEQEAAGSFALETIPRIGYRLRVATGGVAAEVQVAGAPGAAGPPLRPSKPSIAVLPFTDMTGSGGQDYFVDGMVEEITTALSRIRSIFVIASSSALTLKDKAIGAQDAANQLGVRYVLEGSVRKAGGRVRIAVQLIDGSDGVQIWNQRFDDTLEDVFALQDEVALAVAAKIEPSVHAAEIRRASARPTENMGSYDLYLRASPLARSNRSKEGIAEALALLNRAIALDPGYGQALGLAAYTYGINLTSGWSDNPEADTRRGIELALRASAAAGDDALVIAFAAHALAYLKKDVATATGMIDRAIAINPGSAAVWEASATFRLAAGELDLAVEHSETGMRLDPIGPERGGQMMSMGLARFLQRRFSEAVHFFKEVEQQWPDAPNPHFVLALAYARLGQARDAQEALARFRDRTALTLTEFMRLETPSWPPEFVEFFLDSIALAEGQDAGDAPTNAQMGTSA
jgi:TolB-like protein/Tfp pilus assembly protein PilF